MSATFRPSPPASGVSLTPPDWLPYRRPVPPWLYTVGILKVLWSLFAYVFIPYILFSYLGQFSGSSSSGFQIRSDLPFMALIYLGIVLSFLTGARHVAKPTRWFGPIGFFRAVIKVGYVLLIAWNAILVTSTGISGVALSITIDYSGTIYLFLIGTVLAMLAALVTGYEDVKYPGERLPFDYPVK